MSNIAAFGVGVLAGAIGTVVTLLCLVAAELHRLDEAMGTAND